MRHLQLDDATELTDVVAARYPREVGIQGGEHLTLTPMVPSDWPYLEELVGSTPAEERRFFRHETSDAERVRQWCSELDYRHILPLLIWSGKQIVADGILEQEPGFWTAHVGKIRLLVHPNFRRRGVGAHVLLDLIELAEELGLHKLVYECAADQADLIAFLQRYDFVQASRLHGFIRDRFSLFHDMVQMVRTLG